MKDNPTPHVAKVPLLTGVLALAIGIVLIICNKMITGKGIVVLAGILFLLTGIVNLMLYVTRRTPDGERVNGGVAFFFGWLVSIAAMILGLCMLVFIPTFTALIPFIFGVLIIFGALMIVITFMFSLRKVIVMPGWLWIFPLAMLVLGIIIMSQKATVSDSLIMILTGSSLIIFGLAAIFTATVISTARRQERIDKKAANPTETLDVEGHDASLVKK